MEETNLRKRQTANKPASLQTPVPSASRVASSSTAPTSANRLDLSILFKLLFFSFLLVVLPIGSYFLSVEYIFNGNSTFAALTAAIMANLVIAAYVVVAFLEDDGSADDLKDVKSSTGKDNLKTVKKRIVKKSLKSEDSGVSVADADVDNLMNLNDLGMDGEEKKEI
ncbi:vacuolar ATPase assembly integral membrane protein vma21 [Nowakowskiella sp. JEL0407]|nr:vacuolar ATPase assembly integral membrane protein vma21 [Nowakowskiella sp. JEL0407]